MLRIKLSIVSTLTVLAASVPSMASAVRVIENPCENSGGTLQGKRFPSQLRCEREENESPITLWQHKTVMGFFRIAGFESMTTKGIAKMEVEIGGTKTTVICKTNKGKGEWETGGKGNGEITFEECSLEKASSCSVANIKLKFSSQLIGTAPSIEDEYKPASPPVFVEVEIKGEACIFKGKYQVEGTQVCKLPKQTEQIVEQEIECTPSGSKLTLAKNPAKLTSTDGLELESKVKWDFE